jgi:hypothetical protein
MLSLAVAQMAAADQIGWILYAICYIAVASFLFWYNSPVYLPFIFYAAGTSAAVAFNTNIENMWRYGFEPLTRGDWTLLIPIAFGLTLFGIFTREWNWIPRYAYTVTVGVTVGLGVIAAVHSTVIGLAADSILSMTGPDPATNLANLLLMIGLVTGTALFIFTREHKGPLGMVARIGRYFIMATVGYAFSGLYLGSFSYVNGIWTNILTKALHLAPTV